MRTNESPCLSPRLLCAIEKLFVPSGLDRFEFMLIESLGVILKLRQTCYPPMQLVQIGRERIKFRMSSREKRSDLFGVVPGQFLSHEMLLRILGNYPTAL